MRRTSVVRFLTLVIVASFALAAPLAPLAHAQQPAQPAQPVQPAQPMQPDLFQETLKAQRTSDRSQALYNAEAVVVNVVRVPGKVVTCAAGTVVGVALLVATLGSGYKAASFIFNEGCAGKWVLKGDDLRPDAMIVTDPGR